MAAQQMTDEDTADIRHPVEHIFSTRKPKDFRAGLSSGLKSLGKGVIGGVAALVAAPVIGAQQEGFTGFVKGAAAGVVSVVVLPVTGACVGTAQVIRGCINQPEAIHAASHGKIWDQDRREWVEMPTLALAENDPLFEAARKRYQNANSSGGAAADDESSDYYALLQVDRNATPDEIRKQYFLLARKWHPDKNPGDETSKEVFQKLGAAYQVLSDTELRRKYDLHGKAGVDDVDFIDGAMFFAMLFGSIKFEKFTGELLLTTLARHKGDLTQAQVQRLQILREEKIAGELVSMLEAIEGGESQFELYVTVKAEQDLGRSPYGDVMLVTLGRIYENQARICLGGFYEGTMARIKQKTDGVKSAFGAASAALKAMQLQHELQREVNERLASSGAAESSEGARLDARKAAEEQTVNEQMQRTLPVMLDAMWAANVVDIQSTVVKACSRVLHEQGAPKYVTRKRALALQVMGRVFQDVGGKLLEARLQLEKTEHPMQGAQRKVEEARNAMVEHMDKLDQRD